MRTQELTKSTLIVRDTFQTVRSKRAYLDDIEDNHKAPFIFKVVSLKSKCSLTQLCHYSSRCGSPDLLTSYKN